MPADPRNVLLFDKLPTRKELRCALANIFRDIQRDHKETDQDTADRLGISIGTVSNARNERADLNALTITTIGVVYGPSYIEPFLALMGVTASPVQRDTEDPLCHMAAAVSSICRMRCPDGPGGAVETPKEKLDALPTLREAYAALGSYIAGIEKLRLVA